MYISFDSILKGETDLAYSSSNRVDSFDSFIPFEIVSHELT
jgi:hypothetical protein